MFALGGFLGKESVNNPLFLDPSEEVVNTVFDDIVDTTGYQHWYIDMKYGENWCWKHNQYEDVTPVVRIDDLNKIKID